MSDTTFVNGSTLTDEAWFNDLNDLFYTTLGGVAGAGTITKVAFPAVQVPSADVNTLDDYEEGTWTPALSASSGSATYTTQAGEYIKIGQLVIASFNLVVNSINTLSGPLNLTGLPFTVKNTTGARAGGALRWTNAASSLYEVSVEAIENTTTAKLLCTAGASTSTSSLADTNLGSGGQISGSIIYKASA